MEFDEVGKEAVKVLQYLNTTKLKPDEKIAVLEATKSIISATLMAESIKLMYVNIFNGGKK